jgi:hypothetical protein
MISVTGKGKYEGTEYAIDAVHHGDSADESYRNADASQSRRGKSSTDR